MNDPNNRNGAGAPGKIEVAEFLRASNGSAGRASPISRFLIFCAGAEYDLLQKGRTEKAAYVGLGGTVLATGVLATISSTFALSVSFDKPWQSILPFSIIWGLIIFNLDRWLVASFRKLNNGLTTFLSILPRLALAILFGFVIAEPMILEIFKFEITEELRDVEETTRQDRLNRVDNGPEARLIVEKQTQITDLEGRIGESSDAQLGQLEAEVEDLQEDRSQLLAEVAAANEAVLVAQAELEEEIVDGCRDSLDVNCRPGDGPNAREKRRELEIKQQLLADIKARVDPEVQRITGRLSDLVVRIDQRRLEIQADLDTSDERTLAEVDVLKADIQTLEAEMQVRRTDINEGNIEYGLLARIKALDTVREESTRVDRLYWLFTLIFIAIDTIPVLGKWFTTLGKQRSYENIRDSIEREVEVDVRKLEEHNQADLRSLSERGRYLAGAIAANQQHLINYSAAIQRNLAEASLARWETRHAPPGYSSVVIGDLPEVDYNIEEPPRPQPLRPEPDVSSSTSSSDGGGSSPGEKAAKDRPGPFRKLRDTLKLRSKPSKPLAVTDEMPLPATEEMPAAGGPDPSVDPEPVIDLRRSAEWTKDWDKDEVSGAGGQNPDNDGSDSAGPPGGPGASNSGTLRKPKPKTVKQLGDDDEEDED